MPQVGRKSALFMCHTLATLASKWQTQSNTNQHAIQAQQVQLATVLPLASQGICNSVSCADIFANLCLALTPTLTVPLTVALPHWLHFCWSTGLCRGMPGGPMDRPLGQLFVWLWLCLPRLVIAKAKRTCSGLACLPLAECRSCCCIYCFDFSISLPSPLSFYPLFTAALCLMVN